MRCNKKATATRYKKYSGCYTSKKTFSGFSIQQWKEKFKSKFGNKFTYLIDDLKELNVYNNIQIICPEHGLFETKVQNHIRSIHGCAKCGDNKTGEKQTTSFKDFEKKAKKLHNGKYEYFEDPEFKMSGKIKILCKSHGIFWQRAWNHVSGSKCPKCVNENSGINQRIKIKEFIEKAQIVHNFYYDYSQTQIINSDIVEIICPKHGLFQNYIWNHLKGCGCIKCSISSSKPEKYIIDFLKNYHLDVETKNRKILKPKEIDIVVNSKIGIEFCGLYWHGENFKDKNYHFQKYNICKEKNIQLIQIFEDEWVYNKKEVMSKIKNKLGLIKRKIYARKCIIKPIETGIKNKFLNKYHLQHADKSKFKYGLFYKNYLVAVMTFCKPKISSKSKTIYDWELSRYATLNNFSIVGGFSKLLTFFEKTHKPKNIISYCDNRWYDGKSYLKSGFKFIKETIPNYFWIVNNKRHHRYVYAKHKLKNKIKIFDASLSEVENMHNNGYNRIWDAGHKIYLKEYNENCFK